MTLKGIKLKGTKLKGTKLKGTKLKGTKLKGTKLKGIKLLIRRRRTTTPEKRGESFIEGVHLCKNIVGSN